MSRRRVTDKGPRPEPVVDHAVRTEACTKCGAAIGASCKVEIFGVLHDGAHHVRLDAAHRERASLRELLDDTILRLGLCDRVDLLTVRKFLDGIEAQRAILAAQGLADRLEPEAEDSVPGDGASLLDAIDRSFSPERHLTPAGGPAPYESIEIVRDGGSL